MTTNTILATVDSDKARSLADELALRSAQEWSLIDASLLEQDHALATAGHMPRLDEMLHVRELPTGYALVFYVGCGPNGSGMGIGEEVLLEPEPRFLEALGRYSRIANVPLVAVSRRAEVPGFDVRAYVFMVDDEVTLGVSVAMHLRAQVYSAITAAITYPGGVPRSEPPSDS
ncbi:MAG: hypothetical protein AAF089_15530 [Bacteroidota bacterium]